MSTTDDKQIATRALEQLLQAAETYNKQRGPTVVYANGFAIDVSEVDFTLTPSRSKKEPEVEVLSNIKTAKNLLRYIYGALRAHEMVYGDNGDPLPTNFAEAYTDEIELFRQDMVNVRDGITD